MPGSKCFTEKRKKGTEFLILLLSQIKMHFRVQRGITLGNASRNILENFMPFSLFQFHIVLYQVNVFAR